MNPAGSQQSVQVTFESQRDIVDFVAKPIVVPNAKKFNAAMRAMKEPGAEVTYHPVFGNDVIYKVEQDVNVNAEAVEEILREVYKCRRRNQMIVSGAVLAGLIAVVIMVRCDSDEKDKD